MCDKVADLFIDDCNCWFPVSEFMHAHLGVLLRNLILCKISTFVKTTKNVSAAASC